jgi:ubiquinone/menaquinone biosynthesis C-methylase UbiE
MSTNQLQFSASFDAVAQHYDEIFTISRIGQAQRSSVWKELEKTFRPGDRVLELGCGTGADACFLAERGIKVCALDASPQMISVARRKTLELRNKNAGAAAVSLHLLRAEEVGSLREQGPFDGVFSNFGVLNCVDDFRPLATDLSTLLKPGASVLLCLMGPACVWETLWYLSHGEFAKAFRRLRRGGVTARLGDGSAVHVQYPSVRSLVRTFSPEFRLRSVKGIGVSVPPSYVEGWAARFPRLFDFCVRADSILGHWPGLRILGDHILLKFERVKV